MGDTTGVLGEAAAYRLSGTTGVTIVMIYVLFTVMSIVSLLIIGHASTKANKPALWADAANLHQEQHHTKTLHALQRA